METKRNPSVLVISSRVVRGSVGGRANQFALEALGFPVWMVSTVDLAWHPGHGPSTQIIPDSAKFADLLNDLANSTFISEVEAVLTGYFADVSHVQSVCRFVQDIKSHRPEFLYLCDPVIGDDGGLYVKETIASAIRDDLAPLADILTPNRFELSYLAGESFPDSLEECLLLARKMDVPTRMVTSCPTGKVGETGNLICDGNDAFVCGHEFLANTPKGSGDLTSAVLLGNVLQRHGTANSLGKTTRAVLDVLRHSVNADANEMILN